MGNCLGRYFKVKKNAENGNEADQATEDCLCNPVNVNNEVADVVTDCLQNSVVLRNILEHFASPELRKLSFVNKLWKNEAQSVIRKRGQFTAYIKSFDGGLNHPRAEIGAFISDLKQMNPVPFSGISIAFSFDSSCDTHPIRSPDPLQGVIFDQPLFKTVSLNLMGSWWKNMLRPEVLLIKKVLQDCSEVLEELELLIHSEHGREHFMEKVVQDFTFPLLKILKLRESRYASEDVGYEKYLKAMLSRAPNLKVLHSNWSINLMLRVLEGSPVLPVYGTEVYPPFEQISEDIISAIKLECMKLEYSEQGFNFERFNRITPMLLQQCCTTTLRSMGLDAVLAVSLMSYGIRLENVKILRMTIDYNRLERIQPNILRIVKNFDFTRTFPNLDRVSIVSCSHVHGLSPQHMNALIEQANVVLREPKLDRANSIKKLAFIIRSPSSEATQFFAEMFPNVESIEISTSGPIPFDSFRKWSDLKELEVRVITPQTTKRLDSLFCGIFPEEAEELRRKDDEYLRRVNVVPIMPAVTCLRNVRYLSVHHTAYNCLPFGDPEEFLFSKVTALLAFARQPTIAVSLNIPGRGVPRATDPLKPYISVSSHLRD